jgi:hypothetical protein
MEWGNGFGFWNGGVLVLLDVAVGTRTTNDGGTGWGGNGMAFGSNRAFADGVTDGLQTKGHQRQD